MGQYIPETLSIVYVFEHADELLAHVLHEQAGRSGHWPLLPTTRNHSPYTNVTVPLQRHISREKGFR